MISTYDIMLLKEDNGIGKLIYVSMGERDFVFRQISLKEYVQCKLLTSTPEDFYDAVCQIALMQSYTPGFQFIHSPIATIGDVCGPLIIEHSYIDRQDDIIDLLDHYRDRVETFAEQSALLIKSAFPEYPIEEIYDWNYDKMMDYLAKAEYILTLKLGREIKLECEAQKGISSDEISDDELILQGVDLVMYHGSKINFNKSIIDMPVIMGSNWQDEEVRESVKEQIHKRRHAKKKG